MEQISGNLAIEAPPNDLERVQLKKLMFKIVFAVVVGALTLGWVGLLIWGAYELI